MKKLEFMDWKLNWHIFPMFTFPFATTILNISKFMQIQFSAMLMITINQVRFISSFKYVYVGKDWRFSATKNICVYLWFPVYVLVVAKRNWDRILCCTYIQAYKLRFFITKNNWLHMEEDEGYKMQLIFDWIFISFLCVKCVINGAENHYSISTHQEITIRLHNAYAHHKILQHLLH